MGSSLHPVVVQYLYVHEPGEAFSYPTARAGSSLARVARRYLECALTQVASLRLQGAECDLVLATNISDRRLLGRAGRRLLERIESFDVTVLPTPYRHRPTDGSSQYVSSRYVFDAILAASHGQPADRQLWLTDLDCVWVDPAKVFAATPPAAEVGCVPIEYPPDWDTIGFGRHGRTRTGIRELGVEMGGPDELPIWVGGELLAGRADTLQELVTVCEQLDAELAEQGRHLATEEQILSLAGALGRLQLRDLRGIAQRILTGPRNEAVPFDNRLSLALWHLPAEKGLSLRRTARDISHRRTRRLRRDLGDPVRMGRRFNVAGTGLPRQVRDDSWIAGQRIASIARVRLGMAPPAQAGA